MNKTIIAGAFVICAKRLTPWVNFTNIIRAAFMLADPKSVKITVQVMSHFCAKKLRINMLVKLTPLEKNVFQSIWLYVTVLSWL